MVFSCEWKYSNLTFTLKVFYLNACFMVYDIMWGFLINVPYTCNTFLTTDDTVDVLLECLYSDYKTAP